MRNLKRVLSLALASAMLLGMMVMGAGAVDAKKVAITDLDKVVNKEAVTLMVDLGIIVGKPDGTYAPTETVDRATMAKLVYFILAGTEDETVYKGTSDLKDVKGNWAEGFINYCYSLKIIAGDGTGNFLPGTKVTTVGAAKMLLVALGYDATLSKYENDTMWSVNIMRDAQKAGLLTAIDQKATDELTRDNAAQMIYNALFSRTVKADTERDQGVLYLKGYIDNATTLGNETYKLFKGTAVVTAISGTGTIVSDLAAGVAYKIDLEKMTATSDMLGNVVNVYYKSAYTVTAGAVVMGAYDKMISTAATAAASKVVSSTNNGTKLADMTKKGDKKYVGDLETAANILYYKNGTDVTATYKADIAKFDTDFAKAGIIVDLINNDTDAAIDVVKVTNKSVKTLTGDATTKDVSGADTQVKVPGVINAFSSDNTVKTVVGYEGLKKDDVVLTYTFGTMTYIEKATTVEGTVASRNSDGKLNVGGTYYAKSGLASFDPTSVDFENTYTFYLDNSNSIVKAVQKTDNASSVYAFVAEDGFVPATGGVTGAKGYAQARILSMDGTTEVVTVSKVGGKTIVETVADADKEVKFVANMLNGQFYTYKTDSDGKYELSVATAKDGVSKANAAQAGITGNTAKFDGTHIANSSTVFLVKSGTVSAPVYTAYTGIANLPGMTIKVDAEPDPVNTLEGNTELLIKGDVVTHAFLNVVGGQLTGEGGEYFFVIGKNGATPAYETVPKSGNVPEHNSVKAIVNGEANDKAMVLDVTNVVAGGLKANVMYKVAKKDANGIVTELTAVGTTAVAGNVLTGVKISGDTLIAGANTEVVTVSSDTDIFFITKDGVTTINYADIQSDKTDKVMVAKKDSKGYAEIVYIIEVIDTDATLKTTVNYTSDTTDDTATATWTTTDLDGSKAKPYTGTVSIAATAAKAFKMNLNTTSSEADVALIEGTVPTIGTAGATTLKYQVTAEDGSTILYYTLTLTITN